MNTIIIIIINNNNLQPEEKKDGHKSQGEQQPSERTVSRLRCWRVQRYREAGWQLGWPAEDGHGGDHNDHGDTYIMYVCLYITKNEHCVSKRDVLHLSVCLSRSIITSHVNNTGKARR